MSSGLYSHTTRGVGTVLTAAIYNADHVNHVSNHNPSMMGGLSDNLAEMQGVSDPGDLGSEVLATSLAQELRHIRYLIKAITGEAQWYIEPISSIGELGGGVPLNLAFAATPLTLRRTEDTTDEREFESVQVGAGTGNKYSRRLLGDGSDDVAEIRDYISTTELRRLTATLITHQIATHINGYFGVGAAGVDLFKFDPAGFLDIKETTTPASPSADTLRLYVKDVSGTPRLIVRDPTGNEVSLITSVDTTGITTVNISKNTPTQPGGTTGGGIAVQDIASSVLGTTLTLTLTRVWLGAIADGGSGGGE